MLKMDYVGCTRCDALEVLIISFYFVYFLLDLDHCKFHFILPCLVPHAVFSVCGVQYLKTAT